MRKVNLETITSTQSWYKVWLLGGYNHIRVKQKYRGRVVLRGDIVKDDSGSYAVFTEQGSSSSQMTAAKVMDVIARRPGCAGQAADAVSAYTSINERRSEIAEKSRVLMSTTTEVWANIQYPLVLLERKSVWSPSRRPLVGETNRKVPLGLGWDAVSPCTQVKKEDAPALLKPPKSACPDIWIRVPRHNVPKSWSNSKTQLFLLDEICLVSHLRDQCRKDNLKKLILLGPGSEKSTELGMHICASKARSIPIRICSDKLLGKKQKLNPVEAPRVLGMHST